MKHVNIALLSNINVDLLKDRLSQYANVYVPDGYGVWIQELLDKESQLYQTRPAIVLILVDGRELVGALAYGEVQLEIEKIQGYIETALQVQPDIKFFVADMDLPELRIAPYSTISVSRTIETDWNQMLVSLQQKHRNLYIFRLKELVCEVGRNKFYSAKLWYLGGIKFAGAGNSRIAGEMEAIIRAEQGRRKKCLLLDLDNTLWGGVVGELGANGIELATVKEGARFHDFQQRIKELQASGIILGIVSKNNWEDVREVFETNPHMVLKETDFAAIRVNWQDKAENIREIAVELNIGLDSMVFIDDNPVEREAIKRFIPEIAVPDFPKDTAELEQFIRQVWQDYFFALDVVQEDLKKTVMYRQNNQRAAAMETAGSMEEYLQSLNTVIRILPAGADDVERVAQLTQKTNQFNLTTKRYQENDIRYFIETPLYDVFVASVSDRFGDNGKVGVLILQQQANTVKLDSFVMSCRVMGRKIEDQLMDYIEGYYRNKGYEYLLTNYCPTAKNKPVENLFERLEYKVLSSDAKGNKTYSIDLADCPKRACYAMIEEG